MTDYPNRTSSRAEVKYDALRAILDKHVSESEFMQQIIDLATMHGWLTAHIPDRLYGLAAARGKHHLMGGARGFPDLVLAKPGNPRDGYYPIVFLECKAHNGRLSDDQKAWLQALDVDPALQDFVVTKVVKPADWNWIEALLTGSADWREAQP